MVATFLSWTSLYEATNSTDEVFKSTSPLQEFILKGGYELEYTKLGVYGGLSAYNQVESVIKLRDYDATTDKSGAVRIKVAEGSELEFYVITENSNYFTENLKDGYSSMVINAGLGGDEALRLTMKAGDYFSIDTDEEHKGIFRLRIIIDGEIISVSDPDKMNDESYLYLIYAGAERTQQNGEDVDTEPDIEPSINPDTVIPDTDPEPEPESEPDDDTGRSFPTALVVLGVILIVIIFMSRRSRNPPSNAQNFTKSDSSGGVESGGGVDA